MLVLVTFSTEISLYPEPSEQDAASVVPIRKRWRSVNLSVHETKVFQAVYIALHCRASYK